MDHRKGGSDSPIVGRNNVLTYFAAVLPAIGRVSVRDTYVNLGSFADTFRGRAPLTTPGTSEEELVGPQAWVDYLLPFFPVIKSQRLLWSGAESDLVCGMVYVGIVQGAHDADTPDKRLRLVDCWKFDPTTGKIVA
jgi:hypothetical protein